MKTNHRFHPRLDLLEDRTCPALTFHQVGGLLSVAGIPTSGAVDMQQTSSHAFTVLDGTDSRSFNGVYNLSMTLGRADDVVDINLGGNAFSGTINATFLGGNNTLSIEDGTVAFLNVRGGTGSNAISLGDGSAFRVTGNALVSLAGNAGDTVALASSAHIVGNLTVSNAAEVDLASGSYIDRNATFFAARSGTAVSDAATVGWNVRFYGSYVYSTGLDSLTVNGSVGLNVIYSSAVLNTVGNDVEISANVGGSVSIATGGVADTVSIGDGYRIGHNLAVSLLRGNDILQVGDTTVAGSALIYLGAGARTVSFGAQVGNSTNNLVFAMYGGVGDKDVTFASTAVFRGRSIVSLGALSTNTVTFTLGKTFNAYLFYVNGGFLGSNTLDLNGTTGTRLFVTNFATIYR